MSSPNSAEISGSPSPAPSSIGNNAPKYGTLVPNRIFVGGISASTTEQDLLELFSQYGAVKATKIISDRAGVSKGYGFVTFETEDEARRLTQEADNIMLKDRKLNIAPAIKKQVSDVGYMKTYSPRLVESSNSMVGAGGTVFFGNGAAYTTYGNSVPVIGPTEYHPTFTQAPAAAPAAAPPPSAPSAYQTFVYQQPMYYTTQQYQYQPTQTVQAQWGAAPQWRWVTPASYPQPECSSQCLVEPSSIAQRDHTTTAVGSTPYASTQHVLTTPSTSTSSNATTTTSTSVSTTPCASVSTSSASNLNTTVCDSLLLIKPLTVNGKPSSVKGKTKSLPSLGAKAVDDNNNSLQGCKGIVSTHFSTQQVPQNVTSDLDLSSDSTSKVSSSTSTTSTTDSSNTNPNGKEKYYGLSEQRAQISFQNSASRTPVEAFSDCDMHVSPQPEVRPAVDISGNSSYRIYGSELSMDLSANRFVSSPLPSGLNYGVLPPVRHVSSCPYYTGEVVPGPRSVVPQQISSPLVVIPSWTTPPNKPVTSSPLYDLTSNPITCKNNHTVRSQVSPPLSAVQPQMASRTAVPVSTLSKPPETSKSAQTFAVIPSSRSISTCAMDGMSSTSSTTCITTTSATLVTTTSTVATNAQSICSPVNHYSGYPYRPNSFMSAYPGSGVSHSMYGYGNQNMWMVVPSYPYWRTGVPYYQWPTPSHTEWPVPPSPSYYATSSMNSIVPSYSGTASMSSMSSEPISSVFTLGNNVPTKEQKPNEETASGFGHSNLCERERRNSNSSLGENGGADSKVVLHVPPTTPSPRFKCGEQSAQRKSKGARISKPCSRQNCRSSPSKALPLALRNPGFLTSRTSGQPPAQTRNFNPITGGDDPRSPTEFDDSCGLMPITPPPTPNLKSDSSATIVSDTNMC